MKNPMLLGALKLAMLAQLLVIGERSSARSPSKCAITIESSFHREDFVDQTFSGSRRLAIKHSLDRYWTFMIGGTPRMLWGIKTEKLVWVNTERRDSVDALANGWSPIWGRMRLILKMKDGNGFIQILFRPNRPMRGLDQGRIELLQSVYPGLTVNKVGDSGLMFGPNGTGETVPEKLELRLESSVVPEGESFERWTRSLVNTIFNDPENLFDFSDIYLWDKPVN